MIGRSEDQIKYQNKRYKGTEKLVLNGEELPYSMTDFWSVNLSVILLNMTRGSFAEFLVRCALDENGIPALSDEALQTGVDPYDIDGPMIDTPNGRRPARIEVKSTASVQIDTPDEKEPISLPPNQLRFSIKKAINWKHPDASPQHNNDLYVFAHYKATRKTDNMLDLSFWEFYVYPTFKIDEDTDTNLSKQNTISVRRLQKIGVPSVSFRGLFPQIQKVLGEISNHSMNA